MLPLFEGAGELKTNVLNFEDELKVNEALTLEHLRALSSRRRLLYTGRNSDDASGRVAAIESYLPLLETLVSKVEHFEPQQPNKKGPEFQWNSPLEGMGYTHNLSNCRHEKAMATMLLAAALRQQAAQALAACPRQLAQKHTNEDDDNEAEARGRGRLSAGPILGEDGALAVASTLRKAAGLYKQAAEEILPPLKDTLPGARPNELLASMADIMRLASLAEAQAAAARRAEEKGAGPALLAKLHVGAHDMYKEAEKVLGSHVSDFNHIANALKAFLLVGREMHRARAYQSLADELYAANEIGEALAACGSAEKHLKKAKDAVGDVSADWKDALAEQEMSMQLVWSKYRKENECVYFEKVPERTTQQLPKGKVIVTEAEYTPQLSPVPNLFVES